jgi:hypothetical protein
MGPIIRVVPTITNLVALIRVTGADTSQLVPTIRSIGQRARDMISRTLAQQDAATSSVEKNADVVLSVTIGPYPFYNGWSPTVRQGLNTPDRDALSKVIDTATQAYNLAVQGKRAAFLIGGEEGKWQAIIDQAIQTRDHAQRVSDAE